MKKLYYLHPFLVALALPIFLWSHNYAEVALREIFPAFGAVIVFAGFVLVAFWFIFRDYQKAAIVTSVFLVFILFYEYIFFSPFTLEFMRQQYAFIILVMIIGMLGYVVKKTKKDLTITNQIFMVVFSAFIFMSLFQLGTGLYADYRDKASSSRQIEITESGELNTKRDIYYIILDEYMAPNFLKEVFSLDEVDDFTNFLKEQGFFIAEESKSNYHATNLSLSSSLNMRYLDDVEIQRKTRKWAKTLEDHFVKDFLKERGYSYIHFGAEEPTYFNRYADENINFGPLSPYQMLVWETTALKVPLLRFGDVFSVASKLGFLDRRLTHWRRVQFQLEELAKISEREEPVFAFVHLLIPHSPYVFDAEGNFITEEQEMEKDKADLYLGQLVYINRQIERLVGEIISNSELEPIIIIQGDHGYRFSKEEAEELSLTPEKKVELSVRILNAYYFPEGGDQFLYDSITPVNSFRILYNYYFNQNFELLEDRSYVLDPDVLDPDDDSRIIILP